MTLNNFSLQSFILKDLQRQNLRSFQVKFSKLMSCPGILYLGRNIEEAGLWKTHKATPPSKWRCSFFKDKITSNAFQKRPHSTEKVKWATLLIPLSHHYKICSFLFKIEHDLAFQKKVIICKIMSSALARLLSWFLIHQGFGFKKQPMNL